MVHPSQHERIVVVHNPNSTRAAKIQGGVLDRLDNHGVPYITHATQYPDTEANIAHMQEKFRNGDTILAAGGDGTSMQVANAVLRNEHSETTVGILGYGNFRDLGKEQDPLKLLGPSAIVAALHPLTIEVNDKYLRDAPGYMSLGFTALIANQFGSKSSRERLKALPEWTKFIASIGQAGLDYFALRDEKIPAFHTDRSPIVERSTTDLFALNSSKAAGIIRSASTMVANRFLDFAPTTYRQFYQIFPLAYEPLLGALPQNQSSN